MTDTFDRLQHKLVAMWQQIGTSLTDAYDEKHTAVVIPSITIDLEFPSYTQQAYEERMLFLLFLLRKPDIQIVYLSSHPIHPNIIDYYLQLIPGVIDTHARKRLFMLSPEDASPEPLTQKILNRPHLIEAIRQQVDDFDRAHIVPFLTTNLERELALKIGLPMYAADPRYFAFGTKSGCRRIFHEEGVQHPLGVEDITGEAALIEAIVSMSAQRPAMAKVVAKLNEGVSGLGNIVVDLSDLPAPGAPDEVTTLQQLLHGLAFDDGSTNFATYIDKFAEYGGIVEEYIEGAVYHSPSVQLRITPLGAVELLSTHDQLLGGADGQNYIGALFPANPAYASLIIRDALTIGERFAKEGVFGRFAIDFVVVKRDADGNSWESYAIEVNLRKGGTTAPFLILQYLTDGHYDTTTGQFTTPYGQPKYYVASDHIESPAYRVLTPDDLMDIVSSHRLHYNHATQTGVVLHVITGIGELGRVGATVIENTPEQVQALYEAFVAVLDKESAQRLG